MFKALTVRHHQISVCNRNGIRDLRTQGDLVRIKPRFHHTARTPIANNEAPFLELHHACQYLRRGGRLAIDQDRETARKSVVMTAGHRHRLRRVTANATSRPPRAQLEQSFQALRCNSVREARPTQTKGKSQFHMGANVVSLLLLPTPRIESQVSVPESSAHTIAGLIPL